MDFMLTAQHYITAHIDVAPWLIFGLLLLAGFNLPVSEDALLFLSAFLSLKHPDMLWPLFIGVFAGAYFSDLICYWVGRTLGPKLFQTTLFKRFVSLETMDKVKSFYARYGTYTLFFGRFIPFGVRNTLFLTAGLGKMPFTRFCLADGAACTLSVSLYFYLYYTFGALMTAWMAKSNVVIFSIAVLVVAVIVGKKYLKRRQQDPS